MILVRFAALAIGAMLLTSPDDAAQTPAASEPLDRLGFLIGRWEGTADGQPGTSTVRREYTRALRKCPRRLAGARDLRPPRPG